MDDRTPAHQEIVEQLPDYAVGALDDAELDRIGQHLEGCAACRLELRRVLATVGVLGALGAAPPPGAAVRADLLRRAAAVRPPASDAVSPTPASGSVPPAPAGGAQPPAGGSNPIWDFPSAPAVPSTPATASERDTPRLVPLDGAAPRFARGRRLPPWEWAALAAAAVLIVVLGLWNLRLQQTAADPDTIAALVADATVVPLLDSQLSPPATGALFVAGERSRALLVADGLPPLGPDQRYQVWLFDDAGVRIAGGQFAVDAAGHAEAPIEATAPFAAYAAVAVSAEPAVGSQAPTGPLVLGGWLP